MATIAAAILVAGAAIGQTDPPASGDWTVSDTTLVEDTTVRLRGNLTVTSSGHLTLRNVTLQVFSMSTVHRGIAVEAGGTLVLEDQDGNASTTGDRTIVMRGVPGLGYSFVVEADANLTVDRSLLSGMGLAGGPGGLLVLANNTTLRESEFIGGMAYSVKFSATEGPTLSGCSFSRADRGLVLEKARGMDVSNCQASANRMVGLGLYGVRDTTVTGGNFSLNTDTGIVVRDSENVTVNKTLVSKNAQGMRVTNVSSMRLEDTMVEGTLFVGLELEGVDGLSLVRTSISVAGRSGMDGDNVSNLTMRNCAVNNATYFGVRLVNGSADISILYTGIRDNGYDGIHIERASGIDIIGSLMERNGYNGAFIIASDNLKVHSTGLMNNTYDGLNLDSVFDADLRLLYAGMNGYNGVNIQAGSDNVTVAQCDVFNNTRCGIGVDSAYNVTVHSNALERNRGYGIKIEGQARSVLGWSNLLRQNVNGGLRAEGNSAVWMWDIEIQPPASTKSHSIHVRSSDVRLDDSWVNGTAHVSRGGNATVVSPELWNVSNPDVEDTSWLDLAYWVTVEVVWPDGRPVEDAHVNATASGGRLLFEATTNESGSVGPVNVTVTRWTATGVVPSNPVTLRARKGQEWAHNTTTITKDTRALIVLQDTVPPRAVAGNITAELGYPAALDGRGSWDNGEVASWTWTFSDGVGIVVLDGRVVNWTFTVLGNFSGRLEVEDLVGLRNTTAFSIRVVDTTTPDAEAGENVTVGQGVMVPFDGSNSTDNDATLMATGRFVWTIHLGDDPTPYAAVTGVVMGWTFGQMGTYRVVLEVTDQSGNAGTDPLWVTVNDTTPPVVDAGPDLEVDQWALVRLAIASAEDNDPLFDLSRVEWTVTGPGGVGTVSVHDATLEFEARVLGSYTVTVTVRDPSGNAGGDSLLVTVLDATPPSVDAGEDRTVEVGTGVLLDGSGTTDNDPDFPQSSTFMWRVEGEDIELRGVNATFRPPWIGDYTIVLTVTDGAGNVGTASVVVTSVDTGPPEFVGILPGPDQVINETLVRVTVNAWDGGTGVDLDRVHMRTRGPGSNATWSEWERVELDGSGKWLHAVLELTLPEGTTLLQFRIHDRAGNGPVLSDEHPVRVNSRPKVVVLSPVDGTTYTARDRITLDASASSDVDGDVLHYRWSSDLDGLLATEAKAQAPPLSPGVHRISVLVSDGVSGHDVLVTVSVTVLPEPSTVEPDGEPPWFVWAVILLLVLATAFVVWDALRRRQAPPPLDEDVGPEVPPEGPPGEPSEGPGAADGRARTDDGRARTDDG